MIKKLKLFQTDSEYTAFTGTTAFVKPNVSVCVQENHVHYNPHTWADEYFTIESLENNNIIYLKASDTATTKTVSASTDNGSTWTEYTSSTGGSGTTLATLNTGDKLLVKGENSTYATSSRYNQHNQFKTTGQFEVKGNIMSLVSGDYFVNADELTESYTFTHLFEDCTGLTSAESLILPATTLTMDCYYSMFDGCTSLTTTSELPAETLAIGCYGYMFNGCTSLTTAPELPATTLAKTCYQGMFWGCKSLTMTPELPATTLAQYCYDAMLVYCTSLTTAPKLSATTLEGYCYRNMFQNCTSLTTAPELPATTLANSCYYNMFNGCTSLNSITCLATDISASNCTTNWVSGVAASGTFIKASSMSSWTTGANGIPNGWTQQNAS